MAQTAVQAFSIGAAGAQAGQVDLLTQMGIFGVLFLAISYIAIQMYKEVVSGKLSIERFGSLIARSILLIVILIWFLRH